MAIWKSKEIAMPYVNGEWIEADEWAKMKEERKLLNKKAFREAQKSVVASKPIDTVAGQKERMAIFKRKLLTEKNGNAVISKVIEIALNDEHPGQSAALKMCLDRFLPTSLFEEKKAGGERAAIQINISGIGEANTNVIEGEVVDD
jgi:hypothetical protein